MIEIENIETMGWSAAIRGMRNPMNSWKKSDSHWDYFPPRDDRYCIVQKARDEEYVIGPNDRDLMLRLRKAGSDHRKFMRMIVVYMDITAPLYWWKEFDTYKVGTVANSCSTMHKIAAKEFTLDDFSREHLYEGDVYEATGTLETIIEALNNYRDRYLFTKEKEDWWQLIQLLPSSYNQKRTVMLNYEVLTNIYAARKDHKLDEWRTFCNMCCTLPIPELITGGNEK